MIPNRCEPQTTRFANYAMVSVGLLAGALLASGVSSIYLFYSNSTEQVLALQQDKADFAAQRIEQFLEDIEKQMVWTMLPYAPRSDVSTEQRRFELYKLLMRAPAVDEVAWLDHAGRLHVKASRLAAEATGGSDDHSSSPEFLEARALGLYRSSVFFRDDIPRLMVWLATPDPHAGITSAEINLASVWDVLTELRTGPGARAYVVDRHGTLLAHPDMRLGLRGNGASGVLRVAATLPPERFRPVAHHLRVARDDNGNDVLVASAPIPSLDWTVFVEFPLEDMLRPLYLAALRTSALLAAALLVALLIGVLLTRRMVRPLRALEAGAAHLGAELESVSRLKEFFSPQVAEAIMAGATAEAGPLRSHRSEITAAFIDLRGYTALTERGDPDHVMEVMREYHAAMGRIIVDHQGTLERFAGDGMLVFFNDPLPVPDHALRAVRMAQAMQADFARLAARWKARGYDLQIGIGIAQGPATLGPIGFEGRLDYGAVGSVCSLAARLSDEAHGGQTLVCEKVSVSTRGSIGMQFVGNLPLKGFHRPVPVYALA